MVPATKTRRAKVGRPDERRQEIEAILRERISGGAWRADSRIPTRVELCAEFRAGPCTIQRVLSDMEAEGFIRSEGRNGTYVSVRPPHLVNVALVFPDPEERCSRFFRALAQVARRPRSDGLRITTRFDVNQHLDSPDCQALLDDVRKHRLMGIFFATPPFLIAHTPIVTAPGIARCAVMSTPNADPRYPNCASVSFASTGVVARALEHLRARGRRRIAVIGYEKVGEIWGPAIAAAGMSTRPWWLLQVDIGHPVPCRGLAHLLFNPNQTERPDGLVITDDNTVEQVTLGIRDAGVRVSEDLDIVAHSNFPSPPPTAVPVRFVGYNVGELFEAGLNNLRILRTGSMPERYCVAPIFEDELPA